MLIYKSHGTICALFSKLHVALKIITEFEFDSLKEHCELPIVHHMALCHRLDEKRTGLDGIMNYLQPWNVVTRFTRFL